MEDLTLQMKTLIHHILYRHKIYRLQMHQLQEMLYLLQQKGSHQPQQIQELIFRGVKEFNQIYGDNIASALSQEIFTEVSHQSKAILHKILHEFHFLNSIRAYEMFQPHFQQPALHSMGERGQKANQLLDDQFERMRLHYMYYGPLSVYNFNQGSQPFYNNLPTNNFAPPPQFPNQNLLNMQEVMNQPPRLRGRPPQNNPKPAPTEEPIIPSPPVPPKPKYPGRGRPPKARKLAEQKLNLESLEQHQQQLKANVMQYEKQQENKLLQIKECICQGQKKDGKVNTCSCGRRFHVICSQNELLCFNCKQLRLDPFSKVLSVIGEFIIKLDETNKYEGVLNLQAFSSIFQEKKPYQIMVSSANTNFQGACWPDDAVFSLNQHPIFQIPSLLKAHSNSRRPDSFLNLTPYLKCFYEFEESMNQVRFKLEIKQFQQIQQAKRRNNRKGQFLLSFFLVNPITVQELMKEIEEKHKNSTNQNASTGPFSLVTQQECQLEKTYLSLLDPYSRQIMKCPVKGSKCEHLQCFDLKSFLIVTHSLQNRAWKCPYCSKDVRDLVVDGFQSNLLEEMRKNEKHSTKIIVYANGRIEYGESESQGPESSRKSNEQ